MSVRESLTAMLNQLQVDMQVLNQMGAGYYSCIPFLKRYNKLLRLARPLFPPEDGLIQSFDELPEEDPKDPMQKSNVVQNIKVESSQLIALLKNTRDSEA